MKNPFQLNKNGSASANRLAFFNILGPVILNGINFFTIPIFTRLLGAANFGVVSVYTTWMQVLTIVMGVQTGGTIATARVHISEYEHDRYYSSILSLSCLTSAAVAAVVAALIRPIAGLTELNARLIVFLLMHSFGAYLINFASSKLIQHKQAAANFVISVLTSGCSVGLALWLVTRAQTDETLQSGRIMGYALPNFIIGLFLMGMIFARGKTGFNRQYWQFCLPLCLPLVLHSLSQIALSHCDILMLQKLLEDDAAVGVYSAAFNVAHVINIIYLALNNTWVPLYYDMAKEEKREEIRLRSGRYLLLFTVLTMGFMLLVPEVYGVLIDSSYAAGRRLLPVMTVSFYMIFLYSFPVNFEFFHKKSSMIALGTTCAAVVNVVANYFLIRRFGEIGAAAATLLSYAALFLFHHLIAGRLVGKGEYHYRMRQFLPGLLAVVACAALCYALDGVWIARWSVGAALGVFLLYRVVFKQKSIF